MSHSQSRYFRKALSLALAGGIVLSGTACGFASEAKASQGIDVYFQGQKLQFQDAAPVQKNGTTLVPFRKLFETLGFQVKWTKTGAKQQVIGTKDGLTIELTINGSTAKVNGENVSLSVPAQAIKGNTMVPLRFVAENSGYQVSHSSKNGASTIRIGDGGGGGGTGGGGSGNGGGQTQTHGSSGSQDATTVEPYVVKGYVRDDKGKPIVGAQVYADNTFLYDSNILGVTDENGFYRLELPEVATTWRMSANFTLTVNGSPMSNSIFADKDEPFAGNTGAIRNFTWKNADGYIYVYPDIFSFRDDLPTFDLLDVELTLTPVDGGEPITKRLNYVNDSVGLEQLPVKKFKVTARWLPAGHDPIPLLIREENKGDYAESAVIEFGSTIDGPASLKFMRELEVSVPAAE
ncbi:hypothetical protein J19TS2_08790 [Cohnella xylanilytica]|nr:hypothetical protein J19TS2_08790 [Cohnella xylanilytica]